MQACFRAENRCSGATFCAYASARENEKFFLNGAHQSLEWITSSLLASYACDYPAALRDETDFFAVKIF
ncbi:MAG: hypothetical protein L6V93_18795 [Clostridiales bacterium]|nr:MAG: hypothetical protein L6V93_18795 [Clostridiales bacterium]